MTVTTERLIDEIGATAEVYSDIRPSLDVEEIRLATDIAKRITAKRLLKLWGDYCERKPGKRFRWFVQDSAAQIRAAEPAPEAHKYECKNCHRQVPMSLYFADTGLCLDCEKAECEPSGKVFLTEKLLELVAAKGSAQAGTV